MITQIFSNDFKRDSSNGKIRLITYILHYFEEKKNNYMLKLSIIKGFAILQITNHIRRELICKGI